jgi:hypothetical protein
MYDFKNIFAEKLGKIGIYLLKLMLHCRVDLLTMRRMSPVPAAILLYRMDCGNAGSLTPVILFTSTFGALAAKSGRGRSSSSCQPIIIFLFLI